MSGWIYNFKPYNDNKTMGSIKAVDASELAARSACSSVDSVQTSAVAEAGVCHG